MPRIAPTPSRIAASAHLNAMAEAAGFAFAGSPDAQERRVERVWRRLWPLAVAMPALFAVGALAYVAAIA